MERINIIKENSFNVSAHKFLDFNATQNHIKDIVRKLIAVSDNEKL